MTRVFVFNNNKGGVSEIDFCRQRRIRHRVDAAEGGCTNSHVLLINTDSQAHATLVTTGTKAYGTDNSLYTVLMA